MKSTWHIRSTRHRFLSYRACALVLHMLNQQNRTTWFWTFANGSCMSNIWDRPGDPSINMDKRASSAGFTGSSLGQEVSNPAAVAGGHTGLPGCPAGHCRWLKKCSWPLHHQNTIGGFFWSGKLAALRPNNIREVFVGCRPLTTLLDFKEDLGEGSKLHSSWILEACLWVIIQVQQSLMVASSDFSHFP